MSPKLLALALVPIFGAAAYFGTSAFFYRGGYEPPPASEISYVGVTTRPAPDGPLPAPPVAGAGRGLVLVDAQHSNAFAEDEILALVSKVTERGYRVEFTGDPAPAFGPRFDSGPKTDLADGSGFFPQDSGSSELEEKLRGADSLLVIMPGRPYSEGEAALVENFVRKGGKLVLVSDPSRRQQINTLAERFGLDFQPDYLYNLVDNDQNFRHIFVRDFQPDELTAGLETIALHTAGSIRSSGTGLAFGDANTRSSLLGATGELNPIALGETRSVLAIADFEFMVPPYISLLDNDRLVSNVADFLTAGEREYDLADFPHFYERGQDAGVDILLGRQSLWNIGLAMKNGLSNLGYSARMSGAEDPSRDTVFLGLYDDALQVSRYLQASGIRVGDTLGTPFARDLELAGTSITVLERSGDRDVLMVLADGPEALYGAVGSLLFGEFRAELVSDFVGMRR